MNAWRQLRQLAVWHMMHQAPSGLAPELMHHVCDVTLRNLPAPVRCMFKTPHGRGCLDHLVKKKKNNLFSTNKNIDKYMK